MMSSLDRLTLCVVMDRLNLCGKWECWPGAHLNFSCVHVFEVGPKLFPCRNF